MNAKSAYKIWEEIKKLRSLHEEKISSETAAYLREIKSTVCVFNWNGTWTAQAMTASEVEDAVNKISEGLVEFIEITRPLRKALSKYTKCFDNDRIEYENTHKERCGHMEKLMQIMNDLCEFNVKTGWLEINNTPWFKPVTGEMNDDIRAGLNYNHGQRQFTSLMGHDCSFPDYWIGWCWLAVAYNKSGSKKLWHWLTSNATVINHKDGNHKNCRLDNLEIVLKHHNFWHGVMMRYFVDVLGIGKFNRYINEDGTLGDWHYEIPISVSGQCLAECLKNNMYAWQFKELPRAYGKKSVHDIMCINGFLDSTREAVIRSGGEI